MINYLYKIYTLLPSSARSIAPAPAGPGFPLHAPSNSSVQESYKKDFDVGKYLS
jgi:hypothetical protein